MVLRNALMIICVMVMIAGYSALTLNRRTLLILSVSGYRVNTWIGKQFQRKELERRRKETGMNLKLLIALLAIFLFPSAVYAEPIEIQWLQEAAYYHSEAYRAGNNPEHNLYWFNTYQDVILHIRYERTVNTPEELYRRMILDVYLDKLTASRLLESDPQMAAFYAKWAYQWEVVAGKIRR